MLRVLLVNNYVRVSDKIGQLKSVLSSLATGADVLTRCFYESLSNEWRKCDCAVLSGSGSMLAKDRTYQRYSEEADLIKESSIPVLGICFGHQLIARTFGVPVVDLRRRYNNFYPVKLLVHDELFSGLPQEVEVCESHREIVSSNLNGLVKLASAQDYEVEALRHSRRPIFGVQFHPERFDEQHPAGRKVLENFFHIVLHKGTRSH